MQAVVDADAPRRAVGVRWRAATRWGGPHPGRLGRKERWAVCDGLELRPRWSIDLYTPEVTGSFGARARGGSGGGGGGGGGDDRGSVSVRASAGGALTPAARHGGRGSSFASLADSAVSARSTLPGSGGGGLGGGLSPSPLATADSSRGSGATLTASSSRSGGGGRDDDSSDRPGGGGGAAAALELGHCHIRVPRLDLVADADGLARSAGRLVAGVTLTPARVLVGAPLRAAWGAPRRVRGAVGRAWGRGKGSGGEAAGPPSADETDGGEEGSAAAAAGPPSPSSSAAAAPPPLPYAARGGAAAPPPRRYEVRGWPWLDRASLAVAVADGAAAVEAFARAVAAEGRVGGGGGVSGGGGEVAGPAGVDA